MRDVYPLNETPEEERLQRAWQLGRVIEEWKGQLPFLMTAIKPSLLHLTYRRQAVLLQLAHCHAQMLVFRPFMTAPYPPDGEKRRMADIAIRACIEAARFTLSTTVNLAREQGERDKSHFHTLLYAHHLTFCAASVLFVIPHIRERQKLSPGVSRHHRPETDARLHELAQKAIAALVLRTNQYSPARRWAVILEELRDEAARQVSMKDQGTEQVRDRDPDRDLDGPAEQLLEEALRAHWEADLAREASGTNNNNAAGAEHVPLVNPRLWDKWKTTDWLDLDSAVSTSDAALQLLVARGG